MKKVMDLKTKDFFENGCCGILWIVIGIAELLKFNPNIIDSAVWVVLTIDAIFVLTPQFVKTEVEDEMAEYNKKRATTNTFAFIYEFISLVTILCVGSGGVMVDLELILPFLLGGMSLLRFGFFIFYEKVGD